MEYVIGFALAGALLVLLLLIFARGGATEPVVRGPRKNYDPDELRTTVRRIVEAQGWEVDRVDRTNGAADLYAHRELHGSAERLYVRTEAGRPIQTEDVQSVRDTLQGEGLGHGWIVAPKGVGEGAATAARESPIEIVDVERLEQLKQRHLR